MLPETTPEYIEIVHAYFVKEGLMTRDQAKAEAGNFGPMTRQVYRDVCMSSPGGQGDIDMSPSSFGPNWFNDLLVKNVSFGNGNRYGKAVPKETSNQDRAKAALLMHRREKERRQRLRHEVNKK